MTAAATPGINVWLLRWLELRALAGAAAACTGIFAGLCLLAPLALVCLPLWPAAEVAFYFAWRRKRDSLDVIPERHEPDNHDAWACFKKWHDSSHHHAKVLALAELIKCWFDGVPTMEIRRGNAAELVARGYFYKSMDKLRAEGKEHLVEDMLTEIEAVWGYRFADGVNPDLQYLDHLQEPLKVTYRPLVFYAFCEFAAAVKHVTLLAAGFTGHTYGPYTYYTRGLPSEAEAAHGRRASGSRDHLHPIVFLHGVGAGLLPYVPFLLRTTALGRPVMAVEFAHLSMRWTNHIPTAPEVAADMSRMLELHGIRRVSMVAHSYGTFYVSCLLKIAPEKVHAVCLLDPVCCCMWSGHLITSFIYNPARSTTGLITWLIARDIHTAATVSRNFFWTSVNLWPDELPQHAVVALSGKDDLVPVRQVYTMLREETSARILFNPGMAHADFLFSPSWQNRVLSEMAELVQMPSGSPPQPGSPSSSCGRLSPSSLSSTSSGCCATASITLSAAATSLAKRLH